MTPSQKRLGDSILRQWHAIMINNAAFTQRLESEARNLEIRRMLLTKFLWEQKQAAETTRLPAMAPVGGTGIPPFALPSRGNGRYPRLGSSFCIGNQYPEYM